METNDKLSPSGHYFTDGEVREAEVEAHRIKDAVSTRRDLPAGRPEWGTAAWHNAQASKRLSERRDLWTMAIKASDVRPGMVRVDATLAGWRHTIPAGEIQYLPELLQVLGEDVHSREVAAGDVVRLANGWHTMVGPWTGPNQRVTRAYIDPAFELAQAQA